MAHRRRSGWTSGRTHGERRRWVSVKWDGIWGGVSPLQPTKGSGGAWWAPPAGSGAEPRPKTDFGVFWRPQNAHFCTYMTKSGGKICISVPRSKFWGGGNLSPLSPSWSTPMPWPQNKKENLSREPAGRLSRCIQGRLQLTTECDQRECAVWTNVPICHSGDLSISEGSEYHFLDISIIGILISDRIVD